MAELTDDTRMNISNAIDILNEQRFFLLKKIILLRRQGVSFIVCRTILFLRHDVYLSDDIKETYEGILIDNGCRVQGRMDLLANFINSFGEI